MGAPGRSHRKGLTLAQLFRKFPDDEAARKHIETVFWPDGPRCPYCGSSDVQSNIKHPTMTHRCRSCPNRKMFSLRTGTIMQGSRLGYQTWAVAVYLITTSLKSVSSMKLHRDLGITQKTAWFLAHRIREAYRGLEGPFMGPAEADETYFGGQRKNMDKAACKKLRETQPGRGPIGKAVVIGIKDRKSNRISAAVVEGTDARTLHTFIEDRVPADARVFTDDHRGYIGVIADHATVNHSAEEYVRWENGEAIHTNGIESFRSMLKRAHKGTFHKISPKHLDRYVKEFAGRHNARPLDTVDQMEKVLRGMAGRRLTYPALISDNGRSPGARPTA